jgi:hypothetical protein
MSPPAVEPKPVAVFGLPGSSLGERMAERLRSQGRTCHLLSIDAPLQGLPITVLGSEVVWEGVALSEVGCALLEVPVFPWPQPLTALEETAWRRPESGAAEREARSLLLSALLVASAGTRMVNPPQAFHLAASPAHAFDRIALGGLEVHPWRVEPAPAVPHEGRVVLDVAGRDRWHAPRTPAEGEPALVSDRIDGEVLEVLVVGEAVVGARRYAGGEAWAHAEPLDVQAGAGPAPACANRALEAAALLELDVASVSFPAAHPSPEVLAITAGPDLDAWDRHLEGAVAGSLAAYLASLAASPQTTSV